MNLIFANLEMGAKWQGGEVSSIHALDVNDVRSALKVGWGRFFNSPNGSVQNLQLKDIQQKWYQEQTFSIYIMSRMHVFPWLKHLVML